MFWCSPAIQLVSLLAMRHEFNDFRALPFSQNESTCCRKWTTETTFWWWEHWGHWAGHLRPWPRGPLLINSRQLKIKSATNWERFKSPLVFDCSHNRWRHLISPKHHIIRDISFLKSKIPSATQITYGMIWSYPLPLHHQRRPSPPTQYLEPGEWPCWAQGHSSGAVILGWLALLLQASSSSSGLIYPILTRQFQLMQEVFLEQK